MIEKSDGTQNVSGHYILSRAALLVARNNVVLSRYATTDISALCIHFLVPAAATPKFLGLCCLPKKVDSWALGPNCPRLDYPGPNLPRTFVFKILIGFVFLIAVVFVAIYLCMAG